MTTATRAQVVAALATEFAKPVYAGLPTTGKNSKAALLLGRPLIENPVEQPQVAASDAAKAAAIRAAIPAAVKATFADEAIADLNRAIREADLISIREWIEIGLARQKIDQASRDALINVLDNMAVADPNWPSQVPGSSPWDAIIDANGWTGLLHADGVMVMDIGSIPNDWISEAAE